MIEFLNLGACQVYLLQGSRLVSVRVLCSLGFETHKMAEGLNFDSMFKILIVGNSGVGKTAFLARYTEDTFVSSYVATVGIDFKVKMLSR